jgi:dsDNA-specific endonuclease/ATPase MutS2
MNIDKLKNDLEDFKREYYKKKMEASKYQIEVDYLRNVNSETIKKYEDRINKLEKEYKSILQKILGMIGTSDCKGCNKESMMKKIKSLVPLYL